MNFLKKILGCFNLAIKSQLEYRFNLFADVALQPFLVALFEMAVWSTIFVSLGKNQLGGFGKDSYLAYALWAAFIARVNSSWMYEFRMVDEIDSGSVNSLLVRPFSFFEFYLGQFMGYKIFTGALSLIIPLSLSFFLNLPIIYQRLPFVILSSLYYLILVHILSFIVASLAFFLNRTHSFTAAKNLTMWLFSGELFPLDLVPAPLNKFLILLPFSNSGYIPTSYLIGRVDSQTYINGLYSISISIFIFGLIGYILWNLGRKQYTGTGA